MRSSVPLALRLAMLTTARAIMTSRPPDVTIGPDDDPYVHRWHMAERGEQANCYIHVFKRDDNDRALHDHRYNNVSVILDGEYDEWFHSEPLHVVDGRFATYPVRRIAGDVVHRLAEQSHRVSLIERRPVTTMFFTGPVVRDWGFVTPLSWVAWRQFDDRFAGGSYKG